MEAVLPLKISGEWQEHDLQRAKMLLHTLNIFWNDEHSLNLYIIARDLDKEIIAETLLSTTKITITIVPESEIISCLPDLGHVSGWLKQQALKLASHKIVQGEFYLTLDADILCIRQLSFGSFVREGKALTDWEPRRQHENWWDGSAAFLGETCDILASGISVTPEVLCKEIVGDLERLIFERCGDDSYLGLLEANTMWSEYSLYNISAEKTGKLLQRHHSESWMKEQHLALRSSHSFWSEDAFTNWDPSAIFTDGSTGSFVVCQSNTHVPPQLVWDRISRWLPGSPM